MAATPTIGNGFEPGGDGYVLRPKPSAYRNAKLVGLAMGMLGLFVVGVMIDAERRHPDQALGPVVAVDLGIALFMGLLAFVGWFTSRPPTLTVTKSELALVGGPYRRRVGRSQVLGVYRGLEREESWPLSSSKAYFVNLDIPRGIRIPVRHFVPSGLEEAMLWLDVPITGNFTQVSDEFSIPV